MSSTEQVKLYNTASRKLEALDPIEPGKVGLYCCGPTVYNFQHIGNLRTYIFEDVLARTLRYAGYDLKHVMNITDVGHLVSDADEGEDKMLLAAKKEKKTSHEIAEYYTEIFFEHCSWLNIKKPDVVCKATDHIEQMIALIQKLESKGIAYQSGGNVYFNVDKFPRYGEFANLDLENLQSGARIEVDSKKKNPLDFALWFTKSKFENQELQWDSPWGRGYPGWHIECSAMAQAYLGESFDIHCGGIDHIPVHHTNEIAQSEAACDRTMARIWMHGAFLVVEKEKMSKSTGGFLTLDKVKDQGIDPFAFRMLCLGGSYRMELGWNWDALRGAAQRLSKLRQKLGSISSKSPANVDRETSEISLRYRKEFKKVLFSDLGTSKALVVLQSMLDDIDLTPQDRHALTLEFDTVLGLELDKAAESSLEPIPDVIQELAQERQNARAKKDWAESDRIRDALLKEGWLVVDEPDGYSLKKNDQ